MKNLVLVKFNKSADKAYLFEIPIDEVVFAGERLLVRNTVGQEQEVVAICDSFGVMDALSLDRVCDVNGTKADDLKRAVAFVHTEVYPFDYEDVKEYECSCDKANEQKCEHGYKTSFVKCNKNVADKDEEQCAYEVSYEASKEIARIVAGVCEDLGIDCGKITITFSEDDEEGD